MIATDDDEPASWDWDLVMNDDLDMLNSVNRSVELIQTEYIPHPDDSNGEETRQLLDLTDVSAKIPSQCPTSHIVPKISVQLLQSKLRQKLCTEVPKNSSNVPKISVELLQCKLRQKLLCTKVPTNASVIQELINDTPISKTKGSLSIASSTTSSFTISPNSNVAQSDPATASVPCGITNSNCACMSSVFLTPSKEEYDSPITSSELVNSKNRKPRKKLNLNSDTGVVTKKKMASPAAGSKVIRKRKRKRQDFALLLALSLAGPRGK